MKENLRILVVQIISAGFIFLFSYTAIDKLYRLPQFHRALQDSPILQHYASILMWTVPATELAIAALLFLPVTRRVGLWFALALMLVFTAYLSYSLLTDKRLPCSCGGVISTLSWRQHVAFNIICSLLAALGCYLSIHLKPAGRTSKFSVATRTGYRERAR